jgi:hypothetical protein
VSHRGSKGVKQRASYSVSWNFLSVGDLDAVSL